MFPAQTPTDFASKSFRDAKACSDGYVAFAGSSGSTHSDHVIVREFALRPGLADRQTALRDLVSDIVRVCSEEQMARIDARWIVAFVAYYCANGERAEYDPIGYTMGEQIYAVGELPITVNSNGAKPQPAIVGIPGIHPRPKPFAECCFCEPGKFPGTEKSLVVRPAKTAIARTPRASCSSAFDIKHASHVIDRKLSVNVGVA